MEATNFITDEMVEKALDFLRDNATEAAAARAERVFCEEWRKTLKAILMKEHPNASIAVQEREAYSDPRYMAHLEALKKAVYEEHRLIGLRSAAEQKIAAWQTMNANLRATRI